MIPFPYQIGGAGLVGSAGGGGGGGSGLQSTIIARSPWAYYAMDETGSTPSTATDLSGNGRNGSYTGASIPEATALFSGMLRCREFSSGDRLNFPDSTITADSAFSVMAFIKSTTAGGSIVGSDASSSPGRLFQFRMAAGSGLLNFTFVLPSTFTLAGTSVNDGSPHMCAAVYDPTLANIDGRLKIYLDGSENARSSGGTTNNQTNLELAVGSRSNNSGQENYVGDVGHAAFFTSALSASDISAIWSARNTL